VSKEEKQLRVESEHALFVAKCIYEKAEKITVTIRHFGAGVRAEW